MVHTHRAATLTLVVLATVDCASLSERGGDTKDDEASAVTSAPLTGTYQGCYTDDASRALPVALGNGFDVQRCIDAARARGLPYAGLQWYGECWGGTALGYSRVSDSQCNTPCAADGSQTCGGGWRNSIYSTAAPQPPPSNYVGCYTDDSSRALPIALGTGFDVERCVEAARASGLRYAGLQWYGECWGGPALGYTRAAESDCNTPCRANGAEICGGGWRNSIYDTGSTAPPPPPPPPTGSNRVKLVSYNTQNASDPSGQTAAIGARQPDVVFLQEVSAGYANAYLNGMNTYERNVGSGKVWTQCADGQLMTWRTRVGAYEIHDIGQNSWPNNYDYTGNPHRTGARVTIDVNGTPVTFFGTHLDYNPFGNMTNHVENRTKFLAWFDQFGGRKIFGGDLNAWTWGPNTSEGNEQRNTIAALGARGNDVCVQLRGEAACNSDATMDVGWTPDHVFRTGGLATVSYTVVDQGSLTDHRMVVVEIDVQ
jgi:endonuclease/exonuclease/phosphatase family metal-dependent hydrolase